MGIGNKSLFTMVSSSKNINLSNFQDAVLVDDFNTDNTGYNPNYWHAFKEGDGVTEFDGEAVSFRAGNGGYQFLKSKKLFDREIISTIELTSFHDYNFDPHAHFMYLGWSSSIPLATGIYDWNLQGSENAIFIKNISQENQFQLIVIKDYQEVSSPRFEMYTDEVVSLSIYWGSEKILVLINGLEVLNLINSSDYAPNTQMYFYAGVSSRGGVDNSNRMIIQNIIFDGLISTSNMPMFIEAPRGLFYVENPDSTAIQTISWTVDDDDPASYSIFQNNNIIQSGNWETNVPISTSVHDRESPDQSPGSLGSTIGIFEFIIQISDMVGNIIVQQVYVKVVPNEYYSNELFSEHFQENNLDTFTWNSYEKEDSTFDIQDGILNLEGGNSEGSSGTAVVELDFLIPINTTIRIKSNLVKPAVFGGVGFGISDLDFASTEFSSAGTVFAPHVDQLSSNSLYLYNNVDGSHFQAFTQYTPAGGFNPSYNVFNFYIDKDEDFEEFLIIRNNEGSEFYVDGGLIYTFATTVTPKSANLLFSAFATTWGIETINQIDFIQIVEDTTAVYLPPSGGSSWVVESSSGVLPNPAFIYTFTENTNVIDIKDINFPYTPSGKSLGRTGPDEDMDIDLKTKLVLDIRIFIVIGVIVLAIVFWRFRTKNGENSKYN